jgi:CheY-like chemotaxis protein
MSCEILVAEDNAPDLALVREALRDTPFEYRLHAVSDGEKALQLIDSLDADASLPGLDLMLLDFYLPKVGAEEILGHLRRTTRFRQMPVIMMTSLDQHSVPSRILEDQHVVYFNKPSSLDGFLEVGNVVRNILNQSGCQGSLDLPKAGAAPVK